MLSLADMLNLIRLTELELDKLQFEIEHGDDKSSNDAAEIIVQMDNLAEKLKTMYVEARPVDSEYPLYEKHIELIEKKS